MSKTSKHNSDIKRNYPDQKESDKINMQADESNKVELDDINKNVSMTKKEACAFFGLDERATPFLIEEKYWQHIKRYRIDPDKYQEELDRINHIYQIASGKEVNIKSLDANYADKKKQISPYTILNHLYYSWFKYLALAVFLVVMFFLVRQVFFVPKVDFYIIGLGHFQRTDDVMSRFAEEELGYNRVYFGVADMVIDGSEMLDAYTARGALVAAAYLQTGADVIISDAKTMPYFFEYYIPLDDLYYELMDVLPPEQAQNIIPIYLSYGDYVTLTSSFEYYEDSDQYDEEIELLPEDFEQRIYGLMIEDPEIIDALGIVNRWEQHDPSLVFCVSFISTDPEASTEYIRQILLTDPQVFIEAKDN